MSTATLPLDYKGPQRRVTRARVAARGRAGAAVRLRKWAEARVRSDLDLAPTSRQVAVDVLTLLDSLDRSA